MSDYNPLTNLSQICIVELGRTTEMLLDSLELRVEVEWIDFKIKSLFPGKIN